MGTDLSDVGTTFDEDDDWDEDWDDEPGNGDDEDRPGGDTRGM
jgi:hypothetical protein